MLLISDIVVIFVPLIFVLHIKLKHEALVRQKTFNLP